MMITEPVLDDVSTVLNTPLLELGDVTITPLLLIEIALFFVALAVLSALVRRRLIKFLFRRSKVDEGTVHATTRIAGYAVWVLGFLVGLPMLGVSLSNLMVAFGALSIGIGLGLQKIAENFVSGLILLLSRPIKVGDRIRIGDVTGTVTDIHSRVTSIRTNDNIIILVPNGQLISEQVVNLTHNDRVVRFAFEVGISYESDPRVVERCLLEVAEADPGILAVPAPDVLFVGFGESSLEFKLRGSTSTMVHTPEVLVSRVNFAIWERLKAEGIVIPFPQRDLHIKQVPVALVAPTG